MGASSSALWHVAAHPYTQVTRASSEEEIQQLARKYRELRNAGAKEDTNLAQVRNTAGHAFMPNETFHQGVLQEVGLIEWPTLQTVRRTPAHCIVTTLH